MASPDEPVDPGEPKVHGRPDYLFPIEYADERAPSLPKRAPPVNPWLAPSSSRDWLLLAAAAALLVMLARKRR